MYCNMMILATAKEKDKEMRIGSIYIPSIGGFCVFKKSYVNPMQTLHVGVVPVAHSIYRNFELVGHQLPPLTLTSFAKKWGLVTVR